MFIPDVHAASVHLHPSCPGCHHYIYHHNRLRLIDRVRIALEVWRAMHYLHTPDPATSKPVIVHADLKPQNVLLSEEMQVKVGDVGLSLLLNLVPGAQSFVSQPIKFGNAGGTTGYRDPNTIRENSSTAAKFGSKNDVYSYGK